MDSPKLRTIIGRLKSEKRLIVGLLGLLVVVQIYIFTPRVSIDFSPTGEWIAFTCQVGGIYDYDLDVYIVRPDGTNFQQVTFNRETYLIDWSHDKGKIYVGISDMFADKKFLLDLDDHTWQSIEPEPELVQRIKSKLGKDVYIYKYSRLSPDGNWRVVAVNAKGIVHLFLESHDKKDLELIHSDDEGRIYQWEWMGNETLLISKEDESRLVQLLLLDLKTNKTQAIDRPDSSTASVSRFSGSNDGEMISYMNYNDNNLYLMDTQGDLLRIIEDLATIWWGWSPDDKQIVYGGRDVYIMDLATQQKRKIVENRNCLKINYSWVSFDN